VGVSGTQDQDRTGIETVEDRSLRDLLWVLGRALGEHHQEHYGHRDPDQVAQNESENQVQDDTYDPSDKCSTNSR
jgi:hypothetical protein